MLNSTIAVPPPIRDSRPARGAIPWLRTRVALQIALSGICAGLLLWTVDLDALAAALRAAGWRWIVPAALLGLASLVAHGVRWWLLVRRAGPVPLRSAIGIILAGSGLGAVLPLRAGTVM